MALVSVTEAAKLVGKSRKTLYAVYIKTGKLSCSLSENGEKRIDTSELFRVFGGFVKQDNLSIETSLVNVYHGQDENEKTSEVDNALTTRLAVLEAENLLLKARLEEKDQNLERHLLDKDRHISNLENAIKLLEVRFDKQYPWWKFWK
jgi:predicted RNase H-like nuclease (RuvC/YqgF family)